ncbi:hypothetical protein FIBSPDRAFT_885807 [Athelia psychrophila]|uniref:Uncharacterized protein n=1 Tax=Athelia psychrophila TaxID=1759441 RepID=A0A166RF80_9AGAM|nr:hypothetical protein FIBSPDRAFT_885807 [Fibularhizoctonia sp. CBS 109695]
MLSLVKHGYLGAVGDYRGKGLIGAVPSHRRDMSDSSAEVDLLFKQSSKIDMPDGSRYFAAAALPIFPHQVCTIWGAFLPHHPFIFYVAWSAGPLDTPWLYLPAFKLCVTRGNRLHDEEDFSYYQAHTRVVVDGQPFSPPITLIIPHRIGYPGPGSWRKDDLSSRISLADLELPEVEIHTYHTRQWVWGDLDRNQWSAGQSESFDRLNESWDVIEVLKATNFDCPMVISFNGTILWTGTRDRLRGLGGNQRGQYINKGEFPCSDYGTVS